MLMHLLGCNDLASVKCNLSILSRLITPFNLAIVDQTNQRGARGGRRVLSDNSMNILCASPLAINGCESFVVDGGRFRKIGHGFRPLPALRSNRRNRPGSRR